MFNEFGPVRTCRLLGHLIAAGNVFYDEWEYGGETHGECSFGGFAEAEWEPLKNE